MDTLVLPILLIAAGAYFLLRNISFLMDESKLRQYLEKSPKAKIWIRTLGFERTVSICKKIFLPLGTLVAIGLLIGGLYSFFIRLD